MSHVCRISAVATVLCVATICRAQETRVVCDFETDADLAAWEFKNKTARSSDQHVTRGSKSLRIGADEYMVSYRLPRDWSGYDSLDIDIFVDGDGPVGVSLLIGDADWNAKPSYWNRHNGGFNLVPGANTASIPVNGLYRGEAGSRNNDLKHNIRPDAIVRMDLGFKARGTVNAIYLDHLRLVKETRPEGILALDFGPASQTVFPGFTAVGPETVFGRDGCTAGLRRPSANANRARDDTFPTRLYQDFVEMGLDNSEFVAAVPPGTVHVWLVFDDCGYWGGETCKHRVRSIEANGREVWVDDRGEAGPADYLFRFEDVEPRPGDSMWDLYMKELFKPVRFEVDAPDGRLTLRFKADAPWSTKVAALIVYPDEGRAEAERWVAEIESRNRREFEARAVFLGPKPSELEVPAEARAKGYWLGFPSLDRNVSFFDAPGAAGGALARAAARGQRLSFTFAVRPLRSFGDVRLVATDLVGRAGTIPAASVDLRFVRHGTHRGFNSVAYTIGPESLRRVAPSRLALERDLTRQFWITVDVPADAGAGTYAGEVSLSAGALNIRLPLSVEVLDLALDEPDFVFGFFGTSVPHELPAARREHAWSELFGLLRAYGMNTLSGGPSVALRGFEGGVAQLDFAASDEYFRAARACGFTREMHAYGGPGMLSGLHDGYVIGATGRAWEQKTGKPLAELLKLAWGALRDHAEQEGWPPMAYYFCDEPRVLESAQEQVQLMKLYREAVPFVKTGGGYSVHWGDAPLDKAIQEIFRTLVFSNLNTHGQRDLDMAAQLGREIYIYNQGMSRYSFGAYQWAEMRKGIKGRIQWHLLALHGYQFFDLDGREPDTAMINWGRDEIIPTIHLARCREGADDFRFAVTLYNRARAHPQSPAARAAMEFLEEVNRTIGVGQRQAPEGFMTDEAFRASCIEHLRGLATP